MTAIYYTYCSHQWTETEYQKSVESLPVSEKNKNLKFIRWQDRQLGVLGKLLLQYGLKQLKINKDLKGISFHKSNKPFFIDGPHFNISHSGNYVVCVISTEGEVGIDVEEIKNINFSDFKGIFTKNEWQHLEQNTKDSSLIFYDLWTKKEAIIKADGKGLSIPLTQIDTINNPVTCMGIHWFVQSINLDVNYKCHFASLSPINHFHLREINYKDLFNLLDV